MAALEQSRSGDGMQVALQYVEASIELFEHSRGVALPRARRAARELQLAGAAAAKPSSVLAGGDLRRDSGAPSTAAVGAYACATNMHLGAFQERCRQQVRADTSAEEVLDQILAIALDHACRTCAELGVWDLEGLDHEH